MISSRIYVCVFFNLFCLFSLGQFSLLRMMFFVFLGMSFWAKLRFLIAFVGGSFLGFL